MKTLKPYLTFLAVVVVGTLVGCSTTSTKAPDVSDSLRSSLDRAGFKDVSVSQDRDKGVVTLGGHVAADSDKSQAESIARSIAGTQVVSNQICDDFARRRAKPKPVSLRISVGGIEKNLDAALISGQPS